MRHRMHGYKLNRDSEHRRAMFRNLAAGLFEHGQIETTMTRAKAVQPFVERLVTLARRGDLHARRHAISLLQDRIMCDDEEKIERDRLGEVSKGPKLIRHLFEEIGPRYAERAGGYTRIIKLGRRRLGDGTDLVLLQLVGDESGPEVGGARSRRREQRRRRQEFADKALGAATKTAGASSDEPDTSVAVAEEAPPAEPAADEGEKPGEE